MSKKTNKKNAKKTPTNKDLAERIHKLEHMPELKFHDSSFGPTVMTAAGITWTSIPLIAQGDDVEQRGGNKVTSKNLSLKVEFQGSSTRLGDSFCRMIVFWDTSPNASNPTVWDSAVSTQALLDGNGGTITAFNSYPNLRTAKRYKIISDTVHKLEPHAVGTFTVATGVTTVVIPPYAFAKKSVRLGRTIAYSGTTATIGDLAQNGIYVAFIQDGTNFFGNVVGSSRMSYTDS